MSRRRAAAAASLTTDEAPRNSNGKELVEQSNANPAPPERRKRIFEYTNAISTERLLEKKLRVVPKDEMNWNRLNNDIRLYYTRVLVRLFLMRRVVSREDVRSALGADGKQHANSAVVEASRVLRDTFGYLLLPGDHFLLDGQGKAADYVRVNELECPRLYEILAQVSPVADLAYTGIALAVMLCIWSCPGQRASAETLLRKLRKIDRRFPETDVGKKDKGRMALGIPEFGDTDSTFGGLLSRMRKDGFLALVSKDEAEQDASLPFTLGPRFYSEVGKRRLALAFMALSGKQPDAVMLKKLEQVRRCSLLDSLALT